jgi:hypothetical protein
MQTVLLIHALVTWFMTGLIWFVQVVHYPLMAAVGSPGFAAYEAAHSRRTTWVVAPVMLAEAATAAVHRPGPGAATPKAGTRLRSAGSRAAGLLESSPRRRVDRAIVAGGVLALSSACPAPMRGDNGS